MKPPQRPNIKIEVIANEKHLYAYFKSQKYQRGSSCAMVAFCFFPTNTFHQWMKIPTELP